VISQVDIEARMEAIDTALEDVTHDIAAQSQASAEATHTYKVAFAKSYLSLRARRFGPVDDCKQQALLDCADAHMGMVTAEALFEAAREQGRNLRSRSEMLRSVNANLRPLVTER
jgi:hypothetical protein